MVLEFENQGMKKLGQGSHRVSSVEETLERIEPLLPQFEISRVANITGLDRVGIPVTLAIRPNSKSVAVSQGKGLTLGHAKASALMESIEIWHAENFSNPVLYGCRQDLQASVNVIGSDQLAEVSIADFDDETRTLWVEATELFSGDEILVPYEMVHADYTRPIRPMHGYFPSSTNGLASGNSELEAICHAIAEVVERDALSLWHFTSGMEKSTKRFDLSSVKVSECNDLIMKIRDADLECGIWNITSDTELACIMCIIREKGNVLGHLGLGSGCHPDSSVALRRALTEAAQTRLNYISGARDDLMPDEFMVEGIKAKYEYVDELFANEECPVHFSEVPSKTFPTLKGDLEFMMDQLKNVGIDQICWVDLSQDRFCIPVARVIIPGLETPHDDDNYIAGSRAKKVREK